MNEFINLMEKVESSGAFSVGGTLPPIPPGLKVKGLGQVALPVLEHQAKALIELSQQSPFGRGEETITDTNVRNSWQISVDDFEFTNPQWEKSLAEAIQQMGENLGLYGCKIEFKPYKLLIYQKGSFFAAHRDTEKTPNMFATLVINLPSEHEGGELIISHAGQSQSYSFANSDSFQPSFVTFYADCYHEVKPITSGYRICLIYNLSIANREKQPLLAQQAEVMEDISHFIQKWAGENRANPILTYLLEHSYTEQNLSLANLKLGDFAKASVLLNAAEKNDCQAFLCLVTYYQTSYGEMSYYDRYSDEDEWDESDFEEYDVEDEEIYAHNFITFQGGTINVEKLQLEADDLMAKTPLLEGPGRGFSLSGPTGNEGASKELWYHRGAVILWPKAREFEMLFKMDLVYGVHFLKKALQEQPILEGEYRQKIIRLADHILEKLYPYHREDISKELMLIGDMELLKKFLLRLMNSSDLSKMNISLFMQIVEQFGWQPFEEGIYTYLTPQRGAIHWLNALLLANEQFSPEGQAVMKKWVTALWKSSLKYQLTKKDITNLLQIISLLRVDILTDEIITFLSEQKQGEFLTTTYGPAVVSSLKELAGRDYDQTIMNRFVEDVCQRIQTDFPTPPTKPSDWSREGRLACACEFCTQVNELLPDPKRSTITFYKVLQRNMLHVEAEIKKSQVEMDIKIVKTPPKFQGTCRKNQRRYDNQRNLFDAAQKILEELQLK
jgi:predicted 2-oxoglutarate/Fe(II)-dependent dioxygenase YbiX